jgi:hypothetical protein
VNQLTEKSEIWFRINWNVPTYGKITVADISPPERDLQMARLSVLRPARLERNATMGLSPDEVRFLEACDPCWFNLDRETVSTVISAAYKLLAELLAEPDADVLLADAEPLQ